IGGDVVEELGIAFTVDGTRLVGQAGRGLTLLPFAAVDDQYAAAAIGADHPVADDGGERSWLGAYGFVREIEDAGFVDCRRHGRRDHLPARPACRLRLRQVLELARWAGGRRTIGPKADSSESSSSDAASNSYREKAPVALRTVNHECHSFPCGLIARGR